MVGNTLQLVLASIVEGEPGARDEILHGLRYQDLGRRRKARHPRADVHGDAADLAVDLLDLSGMDPRADFESERDDLSLMPSRAGRGLNIAPIAELAPVGLDDLNSSTAILNWK